MEGDENENSGVVDASGDVENQAAVNSQILDYYKKFGRKRDLEQYFSLSTAQSDVKDTSGIFWRRMKSENDSDSGDKKSDSSQELCRISIRCSIPEPCSSQDENTKSKTESESPPIIIEEVAADVPAHSDDESMNSDDNHSQKSIDVMLDTSMNKPLSPSSSITSQRKLEWDSLADVGYANEGDRTPASGLSTLEKLALKQQYSNSDTTKNNLGVPTAHSTPLDDNENKTKSKKTLNSKTTKIYKKDSDHVEINVPYSSEIKPQAINLNLTKHISFNVEKDGRVAVEDIKKDVSVSPEKVSFETEATPLIRFDKEIQTTLNREKSIVPTEVNKPPPLQIQRVPVLISVNSLRKKNKRRKFRLMRRKMRSKKRLEAEKENIPVQEKNGEQVSEAESFEYMPGHIYNQKKDSQSRSNNTAGNRSSLESSGVLTTDSSKGSKHSFTKDLEKSIDLLKTALHKRYDDDSIKQRLIKEVIQRLLKSKYRDDESTTDFLSGLSFNSKKLGLREVNTTSSTSDANNSVEKHKITRPKKSILRIDKFNPNAIASTSQSAPNLSLVANSEKSVNSHFAKPLTSHTESDGSSKEKTSSDHALIKTSSEVLYQKYLEARRREEAYKRHLKDKEMFLKHKLVCSETALKPLPDVKTNNRLKDLIKDLTRNNYDDGSGDASKLEGGSNSNQGYEKSPIKIQRSHSVFTLSSGKSDCQNKKLSLKKRLQSDIRNLSKPGTSKDASHYCCCPHHSTNTKTGVTDSSVQVNIKHSCNEECLQEKKHSCTPREDRKSPVDSPRNVARVVSDNVTGDIKYVCLCSDKAVVSRDQDNILIYKCSRLTNRGIQLNAAPSKISNSVSVQCENIITDKNMPSTSKTQHATESSSSEDLRDIRRMSKSSQTNLMQNLLRRKSSDRSVTSTSSNTYNILRSSRKRESDTDMNEDSQKQNTVIHEATRCVQTDISINPRISDPSLTDINIINDKDCVILISEQFRKVSKSVSDVNMATQKQSEGKIYPSSGSVRNILTENIRSYESTQIVINNDVPHIQSGIDRDTQSDKEGSNDIKEILKPDNYAIPIHGTNMTLMVSIGANNPKIDAEKVAMDMKTTGIGTDKLIHNEQATCLSEECSKAVQSQNDEIFAAITTEGDGRFDINHNNNTQNTKAVNSYFVQKEYTSNTYPKKVQINERKPLLRSNTDTGILEKHCSIQTDILKTKDKGNQDNFFVLKPPVKNLDESVTKLNDNIETSLPNQDDSLNRKRPTRKESIKEHKLDIGTREDIPVEEKKIGEQLVGEPHCTNMGKEEVAQEHSSNVNTLSRETSSNYNNSERSRHSSLNSEKLIKESRKPSSEKESEAKDPILDTIQNIIRRYSKKDIEKNKKKKCFKEIMTVLNYLLDPDDATDIEQIRAGNSSTPNSDLDCKKTEDKVKQSVYCETKQFVDKAVQLSNKKSKKIISTESSDVPASTDLPGTSSDSATCRVLNKIKKECDKYYQKRCKSKKCEVSSTTSMNCEQCKKVHRCSCRDHKCKGHKSKSALEKIQKKCVAYNLIIQTSESMVSEETVCDRSPLQNIVVKVPSKRKKDVPLREMAEKLGKEMPSPRKMERSKSLPNDSDVSSSCDFAKKAQVVSVREYLEKNRPDFVEKCTKRQNCLKFISETRANERAVQRELLSLRVERPELMHITEGQLQTLAEQIGVDLRRRKVAPKFISEHDMKKHSKNIYKSLPEVVRKKEELRKENIKKTNLLMANIFKKNLQKKTLRGSVNLSNYNPVIKI